ncbi:DUF6443 domain-containing protein [Chryseobacterium sp. c4a]|uniref:DUF6443 domain-containing protein n=1 Tax=Chryseobacterium sp. c4a TaxID=1573582 RepID=UPI00135C2778|nr:DUF6443 domain-containing protein [Chryseobacterium sp. c4a]
MKKSIITIGLLLISIHIEAQLSTTENYTQVRTYLEPVTQPSDNAKQVRVVEYFDGLGRSKQVVNVKASPLGNDIVTHIEYDQFGRQSKEFLPIPQANSLNGAIVTDPLNNVSSTLYGTEKIYAEKVFENSPLDRVQQQIQVGKDWANKPIKFQYETNGANEVYQYSAKTIWENEATKSEVSLPTTETYAPGTLYKNTVTDEDGNQTVEFKNAKGQTLLVRKIMSATVHVDTYYVYNEYDQLAFVIPPNAVHQVITEVLLNNLCYQYRYDNKGRLVEKKLPGKGWEFMVYDKQDRVILSQDAILGTTTNNFMKKGWLFTKYDKFGRVVYSGFFSNTATRTAMQTAINKMTANPGNNETRSATPFSQNGLDVYYTKSAFPTGSMTVLSVNYYDTYPTGTPAIPATILGQNTITDTQNSTVNTKSMAVASYVKNIDDDNWTKTFTWYDSKGRKIGSHSINYLGGFTKNEALLDFTGIIKESYVYHKRTANDQETKIREVFDYDHQNRLVSHKHKVNNYKEEPLAGLSYNELGQLANKKIGRYDADNYEPLQSIDYKYNIRGWLTNINDPENLGNDFFAMQLKYQNPQDTQNGIAKYNGNIAEVDWKTSSDKIHRRYSYTYDPLNRVTKGTFLTPYLTSNVQNHFYDEEVSYDLNGNIKTLNRFQSPPPGSSTAMHIDELVYEYEIPNLSNKLTKVTDNRNNPSGYPNGGNTIDYDLNGNMTSQKDKGISSITYNYLNLPKQILAAQGNTSYLYRADGAKLKKVYGNKTTEYLDGFQYENGILKLIPTTEGTYDLQRTQYIYDYKDHLGNIRLTFAAADGGGWFYLKENNYYPFGLSHQGYNDFDNLKDFDIPYHNKYNGKELQETGMYDYGARMYMPDLGRWGVTDPLAEKMTRYSPYNYAFNNPIRFIDPDGRAPEGWGLKGTQWEWHDKVTKDNYISMGYSAFSDGFTNNQYTSSRGSSVTLGPGGPGDWSETMIYNEGKEHTFGMYYGKWFSKLNGNVSSFTASSFDFTAVDYNAGLKNLNFEGLDTNLNIKLLNVKGGLSAPNLIGSNANIQGYLEGTVGEAKLSFTTSTLAFSLGAKGLTGFAGANLQTNKYGWSADVGAIASIAEIEGNWSATSPNGQWGINLTGSIPIGAVGAKGGASYLYNPKNNSFSVGVSGKVADGLGLGGDLKLTFPNPFSN